MPGWISRYPSCRLRNTPFIWCQSISQSTRHVSPPFAHSRHHWSGRSVNTGRLLSSIRTTFGHSCLLLSFATSPPVDRSIDRPKPRLSLAHDHLPPVSCPCCVQYVGSAYSIPYFHVGWHLICHALSTNPPCPRPLCSYAINSGQTDRLTQYC